MPQLSLNISNQYIYIFYLHTLSINHLVLLGRYHDKRDAEDAVDALNGRQYDGRELRISIDAGRPGGGGGR